jgi:hypothetical protein
MVEQEDVGEAVEILQALKVLGKHLDGAVNTGATRRLNRHAFGLYERCADDTDWLHINHLLSSR